MMKKVLFGLGAIVAILVILGFIAPREMKIEREIVINKPKQMVFDHLKMLKNMETWSPFLLKDPKVLKEYAGQDGTVGFVMAWSGNKEVGEGEQEIMKITEGERLDVELRFKEPMSGVSQAYFLTQDAENSQTKVTWGYDGRIKFPFNIVCMFIDGKSMMVAEFDKGLANLKTQLESEPAKAAPTPAPEPTKKGKGKKKS